MTQPSDNGMRERCIAAAAQLWCLPEYSSREMDADFAEAVANAMEAFARDEIRRELTYLRGYTAEMEEGVLEEIDRRLAQLEEGHE